MEFRRWSAYGVSLEQCKQKCIDAYDCKAVEYRAGDSICFKCIDPSPYHSYEDKSDKATALGKQSSVHQQGISYFCYLPFTYQIIFKK